MQTQYKFTVYDEKLDKLISNYYFSDMSFDAAKRHLLKVTHIEMAKILNDLSYSDNSEFEMNEDINCLGFSILVNDKVVCKVTADPIYISDDYNFRKYRDYSITYFDRKFYVVSDCGRVIHVSDRDPNITIEESFENIYNYIDDCIRKGNTNEKN